MAVPASCPDDRGRTNSPGTAKDGNGLRNESLGNPKPRPIELPQPGASEREIGARGGSGRIGKSYAHRQRASWSSAPSHARNYTTHLFSF
ncbi:MAG: hypothetical protein QOJ15_2164 [Bradyrhizobium sp.]|jgi:hypothetical protein|nr:hypothetical protein [Bradyrhizobium sp.]